MLGDDGLEIAFSLIADATTPWPKAVRVIRDVPIPERRSAR
jgi:hypothetical protein